MLKKNYNSLDLLKFIMACSVVAIHSFNFDYIDRSIGVKVVFFFLQLPVPIFFISSGFLLGIKMKKPLSLFSNQVVLESYLKKLSVLYIIWSLIYLPLSLYDYFWCGTGFLDALLHYLRGMLISGDNYMAWQLWYLPATIYAVFFIKIFIKKWTSHQLLIICSLIFLLSIFISFVMVSDIRTLETVKRILWSIFSAGKGRILTGFFYVFVGILLADLKLPIHICCIGFVCFFVLGVFSDNSSHRIILTALTSIPLFYIFKSINIPDSKIYPILRGLSTYIYLTHVLLIFILWYVIFDIGYGHFYQYIISLTCSVFVSSIILLIKNTIPTISKRKPN